MLPDGWNAAEGLQQTTWQPYLERTWGQVIPTQHVWTPNCNRRLPAVSQPTTPALPAATPNPRYQRHLSHSRRLAALLSSFTLHGCSCTKRPRIHDIPCPALWITVSGSCYIRKLRAKPTRFPKYNPTLTLAQLLLQNTKQPFCHLLGKDKACWGFLAPWNGYFLRNGKQNREIEGHWLQC